MKLKIRIAIIAAALAALAAFTAGCVTAMPPRVIQASAAEPARFIEVSGSGKAQAKPDTAQFNVGVEEYALTAEEAQNAANLAANAIAEAVKGKGVKPEDVQTSGVSLWAEEVPEEQGGVSIDPNGTAPQYPVNSPNPEDLSIEPSAIYKASVNMSVKTNDIDGIGALMTAATQAGANQIYGLSFSLSDDSAAYAQAVTAALENAKSKAEHIAAQTGSALGIIWEVTEQGYSSPVMYKEAAMRGAGATASQDVALNVEAGMLDVTASVVVKYGMTD